MKALLTNSEMELKISQLQNINQNQNPNNMNEPQISISKDWKTKERLQLIKKAAQGLLDVGVMSESQCSSIHNAVDAELESANLLDH